MKSLKSLPPIYLLLIVAFFSLFFGCQKKSVIDNEEIAVFNKIAANHNKMLIEALVSGKKVQVQDTSDAAPTSNTPLPTSTSDYTVSLVNGMLKFNNSNGMLSFLAAMDTAISNWDNANDPELSGAASEKSIAGNTTKNAFDAAIGLNSLRKKYEMAFYDDNNFKNNLPFEITEEDSRTVLNDKHEVQIGTTVYKFMCNNVVAEILNEDYATLQFLRDHPGVINNSPNLTLKNIITGEALPQTTVPAGPLSECTASLTYYFEKNYEGDYRQVYLVIFPKAQKDGNTVYCGWYYNVAWGDGFSTSPPNNVNGVLKHTYNVNPSPGQCQSFNIVFNIQAITCSVKECNNVVSPTLTQSVNICNALSGCGRNTNYKESAPINFSFGGIQYRIIGGVGAQHNTSLWPRRNMIYSRTFWQKQVNGTWYPTSNRNVHLTARVYGPVFKNSCTTTSQRDRSTTKRKQVHVEVNDIIGEDFGYTRVDPNTINSDHTVFINIGAGYTATITGFKLQ